MQILTKVLPNSILFRKFMTNVIALQELLSEHSKDSVLCSRKWAVLKNHGYFCGPNLEMGEKQMISKSFHDLWGLDPLSCWPFSFCCIFKSGTIMNYNRPSLFSDRLVITWRINMFLLILTYGNFIFPAFLKFLLQTKPLGSMFQK